MAKKTPKTKKSDESESLLDKVVEKVEEIFQTNDSETEIKKEIKIELPNGLKKFDKFKGI